MQRRCNGHRSFPLKPRSKRSGLCADAMSLLGESQNRVRLGCIHAIICKGHGLLKRHPLSSSHSSVEQRPRRELTSPVSGAQRVDGPRSVH